MLSEKTLSLTKRGGHTYMVNIIKKDKNTEKKLNLGLFFSEPCLNLSYCFKFKSEHVLPEKKLFWASLYYLLINIYGIKSQVFDSFRYLLGFLGLCK